MTTCFAARSAGVSVLAAAIFAAVGCGGGAKPTGMVAGTVKYDGSPVTTGVVNFLSKTGAAAMAKIDDAGAYKVDAPLEAGEYSVYVSPPTPEQLPPGTKPPPAKKFEVPAKYRDPASSGVTVTVKSGANDIPVVLAGK